MPLSTGPRPNATRSHLSHVALLPFSDIYLTPFDWASEFFSRLAFPPALLSFRGIRPLCLRRSCATFLSAHMNWSTTVVTAASSDTEPSIVVNFDYARYIFNVGENTNRSFSQKKCPRRKIRGVFVTQTGTQRTGGLAGRFSFAEFQVVCLMSFAGLLMSLADASITKLDVVGPPGLVHSIAAMRSFVYRYFLGGSNLHARF